MCCRKALQYGLWARMCLLVSAFGVWRRHSDIVAYHRAGVADAVGLTACAAVADKHEAAVVVVAVVIFYMCVGAVVVAVKSLGVPRSLVV